MGVKSISHFNHTWQFELDPPENKTWGIIWSFFPLTSWWGALSWLGVYQSCSICVLTVDSSFHFFGFSIKLGSLGLSFSRSSQQNGCSRCLDLPTAMGSRRTPGFSSPAVSELRLKSVLWSWTEILTLFGSWVGKVGEGREGFREMSREGPTKPGEFMSIFLGSSQNVWTKTQKQQTEISWLDVLEGILSILSNDSFLELEDDRFLMAPLNWKLESDNFKNISRTDPPPPRTKISYTWFFCSWQRSYKSSIVEVPLFCFCLGSLPKTLYSGITWLPTHLTAS